MDRSKTDERQQVLAARGWETDRDRTRGLRSLLGDHTQRVYLWFYQELRSRDRAVELSREALLWVSRTLDQIPEERPLDAWVFEHLATETPARLDLRRSELGPEPTLVLGDDPNTHYLESYPTTRKFLDAHTRYRAAPDDATLVQRSGWAQVVDDLEHFLDGHFGEEVPDEGNESSPLRHRLSRKRMGFKQYFQLAVLAGVAYWVLNLYLENRQLLGDVERLQAALAESAPEDPSQAIGTIQNPRLEPGELELHFRWRPVDGITSYRLSLYTSKMEKLWDRSEIETPDTLVPIEEVGGFDPEGSYLFRIDGFDGEAVVASSGYISYPPI